METSEAGPEFKSSSSMSPILHYLGNLSWDIFSARSASWSWPNWESLSSEMSIGLRMRRHGCAGIALRVCLRSWRGLTSSLISASMCPSHSLANKSPDADSVLPSASSCSRRSQCWKALEWGWWVPLEIHCLHSQCCSKDAQSSLPEFSNNLSISLFASMLASFQTIFHKAVRIISLNIHTTIPFHCSQPFNSFPLHCE